MGRFRLHPTEPLVRKFSVWKGCIDGLKVKRWLLGIFRNCYTTWWKKCRYHIEMTKWRWNRKYFSIGAISLFFCRHVSHNVEVTKLCLKMRISFDRFELCFMIAWSTALKLSGTSGRSSFTTFRELTECSSVWLLWFRNSVLLSEKSWIEPPMPSTKIGKLILFNFMFRHKSSPKQRIKLAAVNFDGLKNQRCLTLYFPPFNFSTSSKWIAPASAKIQFWHTS